MENILKTSIMVYLQIDNSVEKYNEPIKRYSKPENVQEDRKRRSKSKIRVQQNMYLVL